MAQAPPQTAWGAPDLQGVWDFRTITPLQRPEELGDKAFLTAEEAANQEQEVLERNEELLRAPAQRTEAGGSLGAYNNFWMDRGTTTVGNRRTSLIIDPANGRIPPVTDAGSARSTRVGSFNVDVPESYTDLSNADRCIMGFNAGPPITPGGYNQNVQVFQTSGHVVLLTEMVHTARVIPLDGRPGLDDSVQQWSGDSRGHWEGDTLVVETENFLDGDAYSTWRGSSQDMKLVERFTRLDANTLVYEFSVADPATWASSWTAQHQMQRSDLAMFEYACHEGNYAMPQMLGGARALEAETAGQ
tara:strand:+ start:429 stop:1334 length:906 start_codon:yes stop_codon:yes gene_type:complete